MANKLKVKTDKFLTEWEKSDSMPMLADRLGVSLVTAYKHLGKHGLPPPQLRNQRLESDAMFHAYKGGTTYGDLSDRFGLSTTAIKARIMQAVSIIWGNPVQAKLWAKPTMPAEVKIYHAIQSVGEEHAHRHTGLPTEMIEQYMNRTKEVRHAIGKKSKASR